MRWVRRFSSLLNPWGAIFWRACLAFNTNNIPLVSGGVAFFSLLAIFPAIGAFVALYGLFSDIDTAQRDLFFLSGLLPDEALQMVGDQMIRLAQARHTGLGVAFVVSLAVSIWSANTGMKALMLGLNAAFGEKETRGFLRLNLVSLGLTLSALFTLLFGFAMLVAAPGMMAYFGYPSRDLTLVSALRWPVFLILAGGGVAVLYRYGPNRRRARWAWLTWGGVFAAALWLGASILFSEFVAHFGSYDRTYGPLGAVVGFLSWLWITSLAILFGAELNAAIDGQGAFEVKNGGDP
jgi:membrane protein